MKFEQVGRVENSADDARLHHLRAVCAQFHRGIISAEQACEKVLLCDCIDPARAAEYIRLVPDELRNLLPKVLAMLPTTDEGWAHFDRYAQFDGSAETWAKFIFECRAATEAVRACLLGESMH